MRIHPQGRRGAVGGVGSDDLGSLVVAYLAEPHVFTINNNEKTEGSWGETLEREVNNHAKYLAAFSHSSAGRVE